MPIPPCGLDLQGTRWGARRRADDTEQCDPTDPYCDPQDPPLSDKGLARAEELAHVAGKAGVKAIYATETNRAKATVEPLADDSGLDPIIYQDIGEVANNVLSHYASEVVLIVGHSPTVPQIIDALGGDGASCLIGTEFDNQCIVAIFGGAGKANVASLQYGDPSP